MNQQFCDQCRDLFKLETLRKLDGHAYRHSQVHTISLNGNKGCPFCRMFRLTFEEPDDWVSVSVQSRTEGSLIDSLTLQIGRYSQCSLRAFTAEGNPATSLTSSRPVATDVGSPAVVSAARQLISLCRDTHPECRPTTKAQPPTRVLDVSRSSEGIISLCSGRRIKGGDYVALSYCWGTDQPSKLLSTNEAYLKNGFPLKILPQTLQDAVTCTSALGYRYLWVDALCIIQDSESDKLTEVGNMASIYHNAAVTIAAAVAHSVFDGYLSYNRILSLETEFHPPGSRPKYCDVDIECDDGRIGTLTIVREREGREMMKETPLETRGWCFQESILSKRLLYYGPHELLFRCETIDCQPVVPSLINYTSGVNPPRIFSQELHGLDFRQFWADIIRDFTSREVSVAEDRIHAIGGVISELEKKWKDVCVFGVWKSRILEHLCWRSLGTSTRNGSRHAPSWSWMSLDTAIGMDYDDFENFDAVFHGISEKTLHLTCRIMTKAHPQWAKIFYYGDLQFYRDVGEKQINYLLIGRAKEPSMYLDYAIAVTEVEENVFQRVGLGQHEIQERDEVSEWAQLVPKRIMLI